MAKNLTFAISFGFKLNSNLMVTISLMAISVHNDIKCVVYNLIC